jgi:hypothetical protein
VDCTETVGFVLKNLNAAPDYRPVFDTDACVSGTEIRELTPATWLAARQAKALTA